MTSITRIGIALMAVSSGALATSPDRVRPHDEYESDMRFTFQQNQLVVSCGRVAAEFTAPAVALGAILGRCQRRRHDDGDTGVAGECRRHRRCSGVLEPVVGGHGA